MFFMNKKNERPLVPETGEEYILLNEEDIENVSGGIKWGEGRRPTLADGRRPKLRKGRNGDE